MSKKSVLGIATSRVQAGEIVSRLKDEGFLNNNISALFPDKEGTRDFVHEKATKAPEGVTAGVSGGAIVGGALGWLAGIGVLSIPGIGPLIAAGPILAVLSGVAVGGAVGGIVGALIGMGIPEYEAKRYAGKLAAGNVLLSVHSDNAEEVRWARDVFEEFKAEDISVAEESDVDENRGDVPAAETHARLAR